MKFILAHDTARQNAIAAIESAPEGYEVTIAEKTRSNAQNALLWPILECFAKQKTWRVNGKMERLTEAEWKDVLTASYRNEVRLADSIGGKGGLVMLGARTSKMSKAEFSNFLDWVMATAHHLGVII